MTDDDGDNIGWRTYILPYVEQGNIYKMLKTNGVWFWPQGGKIRNLSTGAYVNVDTISSHVALDSLSANALAACHTVLPVFICPSDVLPKIDNNGFGKSNYNGCAGCPIILLDGNTSNNGTIWSCASLKGRQQTGVLVYSNDNNVISTVAMRDITDGTSNTIAVGEVSVNRDNVPTNYTTRGWPSWATGTADDGTFPTWAGGNNNAGCNGFDGGGSTFGITGPGFYINRRNGQQSLACFGSQHPGGAQFAFADGSVHFLSQNINMIAYERVGGRNDGLPVSLP